MKITPKSVTLHICRSADGAHRPTQVVTADGHTYNRDSIEDWFRVERSMAPPPATPMRDAHHVAAAQAAQAFESAEMEEVAGDQTLLRELFALRRLERLSRAASADAERERKAVRGLRRDRSGIAPGSRSRHNPRRRAGRPSHPRLSRCCRRA